MALPKLPPHFSGGSGQFMRPVRVGFFIRDSMAGGGSTYGQALYKEYANLIKGIPYRAKNKKGAVRKPMSYGSFRIYLYWARELGLLQYVNPDGSTPVDVVQGEPSSSPGLSDRLYFKMADGADNSSDWYDLHASFMASKGYA